MKCQILSNLHCLAALYTNVAAYDGHCSSQWVDVCLHVAEQTIRNARQPWQASHSSAFEAAN